MVTYNFRFLKNDVRYCYKWRQLFSSVIVIFQQNFEWKLFHEGPKTAKNP